MATSRVAVATSRVAILLICNWTREKTPGCVPLARPDPGGDKTLFPLRNNTKRNTRLGHTGKSDGGQKYPQHAEGVS